MALTDPHPSFSTAGTRMDRAAATCGTQAAAQSSQDKATATSLSAAKLLSAKLRLQARLTRLGLTLQIRMGQIPTFRNKAHSPE